VAVCYEVHTGTIKNNKTAVKTTETGRHQLHSLESEFITEQNVALQTYRELVFIAKARIIVIQL